MPRVALFDPISWEVQAIQGARALWMQGARPGDIAQIPLTCALGNAPWLFYKACHDWMGMLPITTGSGVVTSTERQLEYALAYGTNVWMTSIEYLARIIEVAVVLETVDVDSRKVLPDGEPGSLIATSLHRSFPPIIRYDLRDLLALYPRQQCACGMTTRKTSHFIARADEMVKVLWADGPVRL
jgi:phenylacetate-coenzyme A ligase PaaK-like adenylate-forming protein